MSKYSPQTNYFDKVKFWNKAYNYTFWIIFLLSIIFAFGSFNQITEYLSILALFILNILKFIANHFHENGEFERRKDMIDNSLGSMYIHDSSVEYYDNDEITTGYLKLLMNLFENSYFSYEISKRMKDKILIRNLLLSIIIIGFSIYGFSKSDIALPILQLLFSQYFLIELINITKYNSRAKKCFDRIKELLSNNEITKENASEFKASIISILINYETNISSTKLMLDSKIFNELNEQLTQDWETIKNKYIRGDS